MRTAKAWVASASYQLRNRFTVAIGSEPKTIFVLGHSKRIDLPLRVEFDPGSIGFESKHIAAGQFDLMSVGTLDL